MSGFFLKNGSLAFIPCPWIAAELNWLQTIWEIVLQNQTPPKTQKASLSEASCGKRRKRRRGEKRGSNLSVTI